MKEWWQQLNSRERQFVILGGGVLSLLLLWFMILSPLYYGAQSARAAYQDNANLAEWMKVQVDTIKKLKQQSTTQKKSTNENILALVERLLKESSLDSVPHELAQKDKNSVSLNFAEVSYRELMQWLGQTQKNYSIKTTDASLKRTGKEAMVSANLVLTQT